MIVKVKHYFEYLIILFLTVFIVYLINLLLTYPFFNSIKNALLAVFFPFLFSFIFVYIFHPLLYWIEKHFSIKTWVITLIMLSVNALGIIFLIDYIIPVLSKQTMNLISNYPKFTALFREFINQLKMNYPILSNVDIEKLLDSLKGTLSDFMSQRIADFIVNSFIYFINSFLHIIIIPIIIFIITKDYSKIRKKVSNYFIKHKKSDWVILLRNIDKKLGAYIRGQMIIISYMFCGTFIPLVILKLPNAFIFSLIIGLTNLIPYIGPYIGAVPLLLYALFFAPHLVIPCLIIIVVMQQLDNNILQPIVYGAQLNIHPLNILIAMLVGGAFFSVIGVVISVPVYLVLREIIQFIRQKKKAKSAS